MHCPATAGASGRTALEIADIFRAHGHRLERLSRQQSRVVGAITACRTADLGGHVEKCDRCGHRQVAYNSCRNRHCPKCQGLAQAEWLERRLQDLLPVGYFHVVFTIPEELNALFLASPGTAYNLLFAAVAATLQEVAANPENLGARIGFLAVLHTWTQTLLYHPHVHCIVPGGGLSLDGERWIRSARGFFLDVERLSKVFKGKLLSALEKAVDRGEIRLRRFNPRTHLRRAAAKERWVVYAKRPFAGPEQVLKYLGRYTHRIAISNERLVEMRDGHVTFRWKDRAHGDQPKLMTLEAVEFLRRFLLHVLPPGFVKIRSFGFLANGRKKEALARCRSLLGAATPVVAERSSAECWQDRLLRLTGKDVRRCPACKGGRLSRVEILPPQGSRRPMWTHGP